MALDAVSALTAGAPGTNSEVSTKLYADGKVDKALLDAKGDLIVASAADTPARLAVGTNGHVLTADSADASGVKWAAAAVPPGVSPGSILNIGPDINGRNGQNHFSVQAARDGDSTTITRSTTQIANGYQESPYFIPNTARTAVQMRVSVGAPVLGSSTSARCELREQDPAGTDYGFDALTGTHVFHGRSKIVSAPDVLPDIVMAQLHNGSVDRVAFRTQLVSGTWRLRLRVNGSSVTTTLGTDMATGQGTIEGTEYEWKIEISSNVLKFYLNDMVTPVYTSGASVFTSTGSSSWYFKAGCYLQTKADGSDGDSLSDYGLVELRDIWHTHPGWATPSTFYAVAPHKATHATGGQDALAPSDIGLGNVTNDAQVTKALLDAKGDLIVATAADTPARLPVGTNGHVLTADSAETTGVKWAAAAGGAAINVKDYGAVGNGTTDDTTAIQNALNASFTSGRPVYLPKGTYRVTATLSVTGRIAMVGDGWDSVIKLGDGVNDYAITFDGVVDNRGYISRLKIDGNCANQTAGCGGIDAPGAAECTFDRIHFTDCYDYGLRLAGFNNSDFGHHNRVRDCQFDLNTTSAGIGGGILLTSSDENYITNNTFAYLGGAVTPRAIFDSAGLQLIENNVFIGAQGGARNTRAIWLDTGNRTTIVGNVFDGVGGDNVFVKGNSHVISGNRFTFIGDQGSAAVSGVHLETGAVRCVVAGNTFEASTSAGKSRSYIRESIGDPGDNTIVGNVFPDGAELTVGKVELNTSAAALTQLISNQGITNNFITGDLTIKGSGKAYRFRRGGDALDLEATGVDLLVSNWSGTNFDGTQRSYDRYSADALNVQHAGKREFVAALYGGAVHTIDPAANASFTGLVALGLNSIANARFVGRKTTAGAPASSTWVTGDVVIDSDGTWHLCTAGGTPGTWVAAAGGGGGSPTGAAGGSLAGTYPDPTIAAGVITGTEIAAAIKDPAAATAGLRTLGTGASQAAAGNDSRLSDSRAPTAHASNHATGGSDAITPLSINADKRLVPTATKTGAYTAVDGDLVIVDATSGNITITAPATAAGAEFGVKKIDTSANTVTIQRAGSDTIGASGATTLVLALQDHSVSFQANSSNWLVSENNLGLSNLDTRYITNERTAVRTLSNARMTPRIGTTASSATPTASADSHDQYNVTAAAANMTVAAPTGTPLDGQPLVYRFKDNGTARTIAWNAIFRAIGVSLPTTTVISKTLYVGAKYNAADSKWDVLSVMAEV